MADWMSVAVDKSARRRLNKAEKNPEDAIAVSVKKECILERCDACALSATAAAILFADSMPEIGLPEQSEQRIRICNLSEAGRKE